MYMYVARYLMFVSGLLAQGVPTCTLDPLNPSDCYTGMYTLCVHCTCTFDIVYGINFPSPCSLQGLSSLNAVSKKLVET